MNPVLKFLMVGTSTVSTKTKLLVAGAFAALIAVVALSNGHSDAWQYGRDHADMARQLVTQGASIESACTTVAAQSARFVEVDEINIPDAYDGCMAGF